MVKSIALLLPVYVTLMWALVLFFQKSTTRNENKMLATFMAAAFLLYCSHAIFFQNFYHLYSFVDVIYLFTLLSLYPLFYAYILLLSGQKINWKKYRYNFTFAVFFGVIALVLNLLITPEQRIHFVRDILIANDHSKSNLYTIVGIKESISLIARVVFSLQAIIYLLMAIRLANKHNAIIPNFYSNTEGLKLDWVRNLSIIMLFAASFGITLAILGRSFFIDHELMLFIPSVLFGIIYFMIGFYGNQQKMLSDEMVEELKKPLIKTESENLDNSQTQSLKSKLLILFEKDKIYINPDLRITSIAEILGTNRTYISRLINEEFNMNFNEFVNQFRVKEAESLLNGNEHDAYTLDFIAEKSGFGNTNSFTRSFKEINGLTPGRYRLNRQKE